jgi:hypothetical protein
MPYVMQSPAYQSPYSGYDGSGPSAVAISGLVISSVTAVAVLCMAGGWWNRYRRQN